MVEKLSKLDKRQLRELVGLAWDRELRCEIQKLGVVISKMETGELSPFDVNESIHHFHQKTSRELYNLYSDGDPKIVVCAAYRRGYLSDEELARLKDTVRSDIKRFIEQR